MNFTLPQTNMEPEKGLFKRTIVYKGLLLRFHACLGECHPKKGATKQHTFLRQQSSLLTTKPRSWSTEACLSSSATVQSGTFRPAAQEWNVSPRTKPKISQAQMILAIAQLGQRLSLSWRLLLGVIVLEATSNHKHSCSVPYQFLCRSVE